MRIKLLLVAALSFPMTQVAAYAKDVIAVVTGDWNRDGVQDAAMILEPAGNEDDNRLNIYLAESAYGRLKLELSKPNFVWGNNAMAGQVPAIKALANGSLAVISQNEAIGRNRWNQQITIAYRDGEFVIAGFTYSSRDTLDLENTDECDLNLRSGAGIVDGLRIKFSPVRKSVETWDDRIAHDICEQHKAGR